MKKLQKIWAKKWKILEGVWYNHIVFTFNKKHWAFKKVDERRQICAGCPFLDADGSSENTVIKGKPACGICGCNIKELTACLSCNCSADQPYWTAINIKDDYKIEAAIDIKDKQNG